MNIKQTVKLAWKSLTARVGRTFLSMLGIIIGIAAVITLVSYSNGQMQAIMAVYESMGNNKFSVYAYRWDVQDGDDTLFNAISNYCKRDLGDLVVGISPQQGFWGQVKYGTKNSYSFEWSEDYENVSPNVYLGSEQWSAVNNVTIKSGRDISYLDVKDAHQVCVLGARAAKAFFDYADPIGATMTFDGVPFTVIGVYEYRIDDKVLDENTMYYKTLDNFIILPYTTSRIIQSSGGSVDSWSNEFYIQCVDTKAMNEAKSRLDNYMKTLVGDPKNGSSYGNYSINDDSQYVEQQMDTGKQQGVLLATIAAISLIVSGIGIMNIMLVTVTERTREIGIRMAIGARKRDIISQFLIESAVISCMGGLIGIFFGFIGSAIWGNMMFGSMVNSPWMPVVDTFLVTPSFGLVVGAFLFSALLGVLFGLYPANKAASMQPVDALRTQ